MKGKVAFVLGAAVGYVLGTRAGRERYEQIKRGTRAAWESEPVQRGVGAVQGAVGDQLEALKARAFSVVGDAFAARGRSGSSTTRSAAPGADSTASKASASKTSSSQTSASKTPASKTSGSKTSSNTGGSGGGE